MNTFAVHHSEYHKLLKYLGSTDIDAVDEAKVVDAYATGLYSPWSRLHSFYDSILMSSCYYPQVVVWKRALQSVHGDEGFEDKMKIFSGDYYYKNPKENVMSLIEWVSSDYVTLSREEVERLQSQVKTKGHGSYAPSDFKLEELPIWNKLRAFYADCNTALYALIDRHPNIVFNRSHFPTW